MQNCGQNRRKTSQKLIFFEKLAKLYRGIENAFFLFFSMLWGSPKTIVKFQVVTMINKKVIGKFLCCIKFGLKYRNGCLWKIASIYSKYFPKLKILKIHRRK